MGSMRLVPELIASVRLAWRLLRDPRTPIYAKLVLLAGAAYVVSPVDAVSDLIPGFGQLDDVAIALAAIRLFVAVCPKWLVEENRDRKSTGEVIDGRYTTVE
jgi:uncharacterized membrane protein YkvA (DUF1232 family)